jgi:hypothetical protein
MLALKSVLMIENYEDRDMAQNQTQERNERKHDCFSKLGGMLLH